MPSRIRIFAICLDFFLVIMIAFLFYLLQPVRTERIINLPQGSIGSIITHLSESGVKLNKFDSIIIRMLGMPQSGYIDLKANTLTKGAFLKALVSSKAATKEATLIPGETVYYFIRILADNFNLSIETLEAAYESIFPYPDGVIFPDTYQLPIGADEYTIMQILYDISMERHKEQSTRLLGSYSQTEWFEKIAIASVVQKEAANNDEMPLVAAVVFNRLKLDMPLQMDGSLNYGAYSHAKVTPERIRNDESRYNTYKHKGIPPFPSGSVSQQAIEAVFNPADVDYLYFVRDRATGVHKFSKTYKEHIGNF